MSHDKVGLSSKSQMGCLYLPSAIKFQSVEVNTTLVNMARIALNRMPPTNPNVVPMLVNDGKSVWGLHKKKVVQI